MTRHLLIDGDYLVYRHSFAAEVETKWDAGLWTLHADSNEAIASVYRWLEGVKEHLEADKVTVALSCPFAENFRVGLYPGYKSNRAETRKPVCYRALREELLKTAVVYSRLEADDVLAIMATEPSDEDRIIVSVDKDFRGVPGKFFRLRPLAEPEKIIVTQDEADEWHMIQTLSGDATDGYSGCPGVGPKRALDILGKAEGSVWEAVVSAYKKAGLSEAEALLNARLARLLRHGDYNKRTKKVRLWKPQK